VERVRPGGHDNSARGTRQAEDTRAARASAALRGAANEARPAAANEARPAAANEARPAAAKPQAAAHETETAPTPSAAPVLAVLRFLAPRLREALTPLCGPGWQEVRLRRGRPVHVVTADGDLWPGVVCDADDLERTVQLVTRASVYAWEEELARGFCTLPGGHRVGFCGRAVLRDGRLAAQKEFGSLNLRVGRAVPGAADAVLPALVDRGAGGGRLRSALVFGPPGSGKTTLLRDLCRQVSRGRPDLGLPGLRVGVVDERSEIAGTFAGTPQFDLGPRTDVLDACPKAEGLLLLLRAFSPQVLVTDEIGRPEDAGALQDATRAGVAVLASAHAGSAAELSARLVAAGAFERLVRLGPGHRVQGIGPPPGEAAASPPASRSPRRGEEVGPPPCWPSSARSAS
jgi:stage III sporulation protein AA